jgi:S1-C subfamily serine protease
MRGSGRNGNGCATVILRWLTLLAALMALTSPARADDIGAASRGVVRVVTIATVDGEVVGFGHGSGFAVAPNRIVTNAHVVELAQQYPDNVEIGIVPSEGDKSYDGHIVSVDTQRDLALIEITNAHLPPLALYTGPLAAGGHVVALGYPGNVDLATAQSADDYIKPLAPVRTEGGLSGGRAISGVSMLLHTANIARGNSGGPLLDPCGRVVGVNSALTQNEEGDSSFGFAIADTELAAFLAAAKQPVTSNGGPCTTMEQLLAQEGQSDAQAKAAAAARLQEMAAKSQAAHEDALVRARDEQERERENVMGVSAVLLVLGALALGAAGMMESRGKRRPAIWAAAGGGVLMLLAVVIFLNRPEGEVKVADNISLPPPSPSPSTGAAQGKMICTFVAEKSRVTVSQTDDVPLDIGADGCINGRTQYAEDSGKLVRILVPNDEQTVSVLQYDPATREYVNDHYLLSEPAMDAARSVRAKVTLKACTSDPAQLSAFSTQQQAIRSALPPLPDERLTYSCHPQ